MAKKTKKMAFGGSAGPMGNRPPMPSSGNSKAGAGRDVNQGPRGAGGGGRDGGYNGNRPKPDMVRPGFGPRPVMGAGGAPAGPRGYGPTDGGPMGPPVPKQMAIPAPAGVPFKPGATFDQSLANFGQQYNVAPAPIPMEVSSGIPAPVGGQTRSAASGPRPMDNPAMIRFTSPEASADYIKRYNESMAATGGKQYNPGYAKGGAVKSKKMASGGMAKSSGAGRGWGKARGSKNCKVC